MHAPLAVCASAVEPVPWYGVSARRYCWADEWKCRWMGFLCLFQRCMACFRVKWIIVLRVCLFSKVIPYHHVAAFMSGHSPARRLFALRIRPAIKTWLPTHTHWLNGDLCETKSQRALLPKSNFAESFAILFLFKATIYTVNFINDTKKHTLFSKSLKSTFFLIALTLKTVVLLFEY